MNTVRVGIAISVVVIAVAAGCGILDRPVPVELSTFDLPADQCESHVVTDARFDWIPVTRRLELVSGQSGERFLIAVRPAFSGRLADGALEILSGEGRLWAREGEIYHEVWLCPTGDGRHLVGFANDEPPILADEAE
jgi:hypothetical protein